MELISELETVLLLSRQFASEWSCCLSTSVFLRLDSRKLGTLNGVRAQTVLSLVLSP